MRRCTLPPPAGFAVVIMLATGACQDTTTVAPDSAPDADLASATRAAGQESIAPPPSRLSPQFELHVEATGELRPGEAIALTASARALIGSDDMRLIITAPDLAVMQLGRPLARQLRSGERVPPLDISEGSMGREEERTVNATVVFPEPGYYRVIATARDLTEATVRGPKLIQTVAHRELWIGVEEDGGHVTSRFDPSTFPSHVDPVPGPQRPRGWRPSLEDGGFNSSQISGLATSSPIPSTADFGLRHYHRDDNEWRGLGDAQMVVEYWDVNPNNEWELIWTDVQQTDVTGRFTLDCTLSSYYTDNVRYSGTAEPLNPDVHVVEAVTLFTDRSVHDACLYYAQGYGYIFDVDMWQADHSWVFVNVAATAQHTRDQLQYSRSQIEVRLRNDDKGRSSYNLTQDRIEIHHNEDDPIVDSSVWGQGGIFVQAHEYGHAYHAGALRGWPYIDCPSEGHHLNGPHSMSCAYVEGAADYVAAIGRPDLTDSEYHFPVTIRDNEHYPGLVYHPSDGEPWDGAMIEGAVAAFLYSVTDPNRLGYEGGWLGGIIRTCDWLDQVSGSYLWASGVDHLIFCMEEDIDPAVTGSGVYFQDRSSHPIGWRHTAGKPTGWSPSAIRARWINDLYSEAPN